MSIKFKIALLFALLVTLFVSVVSVSVYLVSARERENTFSTRLKNRALSTAKVYAGIKDNNFSVLRKMDTAAVASLYRKSIVIMDKNDSIDYAFSDNSTDSFYLSKKEMDRALLTNEYFFEHNKQKAVAIHYNGSFNNFTIAVAALDIDGIEYLYQLKKSLLSALLVAAIFSYLAGLVFAKSLIMPIKRITKEVNLITSNNLSQHIKINRAKDELTQLAQTFNDLLDRLQGSFVVQRNFISNASHELSTPLTSISSQLEVAMQKDRAPEEYRDVMQSIYEDIRELQQLTHSLLDIAKTSTQGGIDLSEVRLDEVLLKVVSDVQKQNKNYKVELNFDVYPENEKLVTVFGNSNLLYIALKNIIENGCKYAENQQSAITARFNKSSVTIKVANVGDIIAESDIQNIFQPFFRTESAQNKPGFGLGLTLTKRILSLHKGSIEVESQPGTGTIFTLQLPNMLSLPSPA